MALSNLTQRVLFAIVAIPIVLFIVLYKPLAFYSLAIMLSGLTVWEYYGLAKVKGYSPQVGLGITMTMAIAAYFGTLRRDITFGIETNVTITFILEAIVWLGAFAILASELFREKPNPIEQTAITLFGAFYIGAGCGTLFGIYDFLSSKIPSADPMAPGLFILIMLVSIWVCDSAAYFAGRAFGKHKLFERVSPKKTWEGAIAGFICCVLVWAIVPGLVPSLSFIPMKYTIIIGIIIGNLGQVGDLGKSLLKRDAGVKDSSNIIPGHGGVLDRLDSILFTSPVILFFLRLVL